MAITTGLEFAKQYLILPDDSGGTLTTRVNNAEIPAKTQFRDTFRTYDLVQLIPETFDSTSIEQCGEDYIKVGLASSIIKKLYIGYELRVDSGSYVGHYQVLSIDKGNNKILLKINADYVSEVITFFNLEWEKLEKALGWYICAFVTLSLQELKACKVLITSTQVGDASSEAYSVSSIRQFRNDMFKFGNQLMLKKYYPIGC